MVPCQLYTTADGWIFIMANKEKFFPALCKRLGVPELATDPRFRTFDDRRQNRAILSDLLDAAFSARTTDEWLEVLTGVVPVAPVADMERALAAPFTTEREMVVDITAQNGATMRVVGSPFRTGDPIPAMAAPELGAHTHALLREAGYDEQRIAELQERGILV
jgi:succinate--hydroxymethylglutarate CoA-transferase